MCGYLAGGHAVTQLVTKAELTQIKDLKGENIKVKGNLGFS